MAESFAKKEKEKKRAKRKEEKAAKKEDRKSQNVKGKGLDDMIAYVDEFGQLTDVPTDMQKRTKINASDIELSYVAQPEEIVDCTGILTVFFSDKGYGFITEDETRVQVFVHLNNLQKDVTEKSKVTFNKEKTLRGLSAVNVRLIK